MASPDGAEQDVSMRGLVVRRLQEIEPVAYPTIPADIKHNYDAILPLMQQSTHRADLAFPGKDGPGSYPARYGVVAHDDLLSVLEQLKWSDPTHFEPDLAFLQEIRGSVDDWILLMPQRRTGANRVLPGLGASSVFHRKRSRDPLFQAVSEPRHRHAACRIAGVPVDEPTRTAPPTVFTPAVAARSSSTRSSSTRWMGRTRGVRSRRVPA